MIHRRSAVETAIGRMKMAGPYFQVQPAQGCPWRCFARGDVRRRTQPAMDPGEAAASLLPNRVRPARVAAAAAIENNPCAPYARTTTLQDELCSSRASGRRSASTGRSRPRPVRRSGTPSGAADGA